MQSLLNPFSFLPRGLPQETHCYGCYGVLSCRFIDARHGAASLRLVNVLPDFLYLPQGAEPPIGPRVLVCKAMQQLFPRRDKPGRFRTRSESLTLDDAKCTGRVDSGQRG